MLENIVKLIDELKRQPSETEWVEFKLNHQTPERIGEYISALANSACLHQIDEAYLVFGIENGTHKVKGTTFEPRKTKGKGAEDLEPWLYRNLKPSIDFKIQEVAHPDGRLVIFFIQPAFSGPVKFLEKSWIRIGSSKKSLSEFPEKEAIIWDRRTPFETKIAKEDVVESKIIELLDFDQYFHLTKEARPKTQEGIIEKLLQEKFLIKKKGKLHISNLGAILLARNLDDFPKLKNKSVRIITYKGTNRLDAIKDITQHEGYAIGFETILLSYIQSQIPEPEIIEGGLRKVSSIYPPKSIREFVANILVHQDFLITGSTPLIEIFQDRIEISNPGRALIPTDRFIDHPPKSRNEKLSDTLRRMKICEKRGSGVDRAILAIEISQLPAPNIENRDDGVRVTIYSQKELKKLTKEEQYRACYIHSCIQHVIKQDGLTNASLCKRFGIKDKNKAIASRIIKGTLKKGLIKPFDPENRSNRYAKYVPYWI